LKNKTVTILISAIGGYGYYYLKSLFEDYSENKIKIVGVIDPQAEKSDLYTEVVKRKIPVFDEIEDFYNQNGKADLAIIVSPIQYHVQQSCIALQNGSNVLCDKPIGGSIIEAKIIIQTQKEYKKWIMIGYQWSFSKAIQDLKKDILSGIFGKPIRFKTLCFWPRGFDYYNRNNWAGKIKDKNGN